MMRFRGTLCVAWLYALLITVVMPIIIGSSATAGDDRDGGAAELVLANRYLFRGYRLSGNNGVVQPGLTLSAGSLSFSIACNIDLEEEETSSFMPETSGGRRLNETSLSAAYTVEHEAFSLVASYLYYSPVHDADTEEISLEFFVDCFAHPTLALFRDIGLYPGTYVNLGVSHVVALPRTLDLELSAALGYFVGDSDAWKTFDGDTGEYTGQRYQALHDGFVQARLTIPLIGDLEASPSILYSFPLSADARRTVGGNPVNPAGAVEETFVFGLTLSLGI